MANLDDARKVLAGVLRVEPDGYVRVEASVASESVVDALEACHALLRHLGQPR